MSGLQEGTTNFKIFLFLDTLKPSFSSILINSLFSTLNPVVFSKRNGSKLIIGSHLGGVLVKYHMNIDYEAEICDHYLVSGEQKFKYNKSIKGLTKKTRRNQQKRSVLVEKEAFNL